QGFPVVEQRRGAWHTTGRVDAGGHSANEVAPVAVAKKRQPLLVDEVQPAQRLNAEDEVVHLDFFHELSSRSESVIHRIDGPTGRYEISDGIPAQSLDLIVGTSEHI